MDEQMSGYVPGWEVLPLAAAVSLYFYFIDRKLFKMIPYHSAMFSVLMTFIFGGPSVVFASSGATSYWDGVMALVSFILFFMLFSPLPLHIFHVFYILYNGRTLGRNFADSEKLGASARGKGLKWRLEARRQTMLRKYRGRQEWKNVRGAHLKEILLNRFDDMVPEVEEEPAGGR
jgi:hypothetical protein